MAWEEGMEPELRSPPPRAVRSRFRAKFMPGLFLTMAVGFAVLFSGIGYFDQQKHEALQDHGLPVVAKLVEKRPRAGKTSASLVYQYDVNGQSHRYSDRPSSSEFEAAQIGQPLELMYLPERPGSAEIAKQVKDGVWSGGAVMSMIVGPLLFLGLSAAWWYVRAWQGRKLRLVRDGLPIWTAGHEILLKKSSPKHDQFKVRYEYLVGGVRHESTTTVSGAVMQTLAAEGSRAVVLYDPLDAAHSDLYAAILPLYRIEETG